MTPPLKPDAAWIPSLEGKADHAVTFAVQESYRRLNQLLAKMQIVDNEFQQVKQQFERISLTAIRKALEAGGAVPLDVTGLLGLLARPQLGSAAVRAALPAIADPLSQDGALCALSPTYAMYIFKGSVLPFGWKALAASGVIAFGARAATPAPGSSGLCYIQTDAGSQGAWLYEDTGVAYVYRLGIVSGTDAQRLALGIGANDNGAWFYTTDTKALWQVQAGVWVKATVSLTAAVSGILPVANGGTGLAGGTSGGVLAYTAAGVLASSGVLASGEFVLGGGAGAVPGTSFSVVPIANGGTGQAAVLPAFNALSPLTTQGDLLTHDAANNVRLALGTIGKYLRSNGTDAVYSSFPNADIAANVTPVTANLAVVTPQNLQSLSIPAGLLNTLGYTVEIFGAGTFTTPALQTPTITITLTLGGVTLWTKTSQAVLANVTAPWNFYICMATSATGAAGTLEVHGNLFIDDTLAGGSQVNVYADSAAGSGAIDLTAVQTLQVTVTFSTQPGAPPNNACTERLLAIR